jgi:phosphonate transport system substrate-binding protein
MRLVTCLAENTQPLAQALSNYLSKLQIPVSFDQDLAYATRKQGLALGNISLGFMCGLLYTVFKDQHKAPLIPLVAPVSSSISSPRPLYYSYITTRNNCYKTFAELEHSTFCINEWESFSGCQIMRYHLATLGKFQGFFSRVIESGSHMQSIQKVLSGLADSAAIDHTLYEYWANKNPETAKDIQIIERIGPFPMPPLVISESVPETLKQPILKALLEMPQELLKEFKVKEFQSVNDRTYDSIREAVRLGEKVTFI